MTTSWIELFIIIVLILGNGVFSMSELAVMTARRVRLQQRAEDGDQGARAALKLAESPDRFLSTVQIGITLIGTLSSAVAGARLGDALAISLRQSFPILSPYADTIALTLIVLLVTYLSLVLGELVPKRLALTAPERIAIAIARPMKFIENLVSPVVMILSVSTDLVVRILRIRKPNDPPVTEDDVRSMLQQGEQVGIFEETETDIVESVFRLGDRRVDSLMTPRTEIDWLDLDESPEENIRRVLSSPRNFLPLSRGNLDNVLGIVSSKAFLGSLAQGTSANLDELSEAALFVPDSTPAFRILELLRSASGNLALVIDEWGGVQGMVTLFDVLEAIVGNIPMPGQPFEPLAREREDGSWLVDGAMNIEEFKDLLDLPGMPEEDRAGYQTVAGFVLAQLGEIPVSGARFEWNELAFEVLDMDGLRVDKVLVSRTGRDA